MTLGWEAVGRLASGPLRQRLLQAAANARAAAERSRISGHPRMAMLLTERAAELDQLLTARESPSRRLVELAIASAERAVAVWSTIESF